MNEGLYFQLSIFLKTSMWDNGSQLKIIADMIVIIIIIIIIILINTSSFPVYSFFLL